MTAYFHLATLREMPPSYTPNTTPYSRNEMLASKNKAQRNKAHFRLQADLK